MPTLPTGRSAATARQLRVLASVTLPSRHQCSSSAGVAVNTSRNSPSSSLRSAAVDQAAREPDVDELGGIRDHRMQHAGAGPFARRVAGLLQQLALGAGQRVLARHRACRRGTRSSPGPSGSGTGAPAPARPSSSMGTITTAPGCTTYSRVAVPPSGRRTVSRKACRKRALEQLLAVDRWISIRCLSSTWRHSCACAQVAPDEAGKGEGDEQRAGDGVELPALRRDLAGALLQQQAEAADDEVQHHQFRQPQRQRLVWALERHHAEQALRSRTAGWPPGRPATITSQTEAVWDTHALQAQLRQRLDDGLRAQRHQAAGQDAQDQHQRAVDRQHRRARRPAPRPWWR